ncbi:MAG: energy transducer TonB [Bacteroidia bacterium]
MYSHHRLFWICFTISAIVIASGSQLSDDTIGIKTKQYIPVKLDTSPKPLNISQIRTEIPYLKTASERGITGEVNLKVFVDANGNYAGHEVIGNSHPLLKLPCEAYVRMLRFRPATYNGRKVGGTFIFRHSFGI